MSWPVRNYVSNSVVTIHFDWNILFWGLPCRAHLTKLLKTLSICYLSLWLHFLPDMLIFIIINFFFYLLLCEITQLLNIVVNTPLYMSFCFFFCHSGMSSTTNIVEASINARKNWVSEGIRTFFLCFYVLISLSTMDCSDIINKYKTPILLYVYIFGRARLLSYGFSFQDDFEMLIICYQEIEFNILIFVISGPL